MNKDQWMSSKAVLCTTRASSSGNGGQQQPSSRKSLWDQPEKTHSFSSLLSSMQRFVTAVDNMNDTILIPCRLMDLKFEKTKDPTKDEDAPDGTQPTVNHCATRKRDGSWMLQNLQGVDLYNFYSRLNQMKSDLMWGQQKSGETTGPTMTLAVLPSFSSSSSIVSTSSSSSSSSSGNASSSSSTTAVSSSANSIKTSEGKGHARRPSVASITSSSASASDIDFSDLNDDSGVEAEQEEDFAQNAATAFQHHLNGLHQCLCDLTSAADYITTRYNDAIGSI